MHPNKLQSQKEIFLLKNHNNWIDNDRCCNNDMEKNNHLQEVYISHKHHNGTSSVQNRKRLNPK